MRLHAAGGLGGSTLKAIAFAVDFSGDELEHFLAAVFTVRGSYEWNGDVVTNLDGSQPATLVFGGWGVGKRGRV